MEFSPELGGQGYINISHRWALNVVHNSEATEAHSHWSGGGTVKTVLYVVNECTCEVCRLAGSGGHAPPGNF